MLQTMAAPLENLCAATRDLLWRWPHCSWWINKINLFLEPVSLFYCPNSCLYVYIHSHTHTHTYIYIYIYIRRMPLRVGRNWCFTCNLELISKVFFFGFSPNVLGTYFNTLFCSGHSRIVAKGRVLPRPVRLWFLIQKLTQYRFSTGYFCFPC
jgi:hypothetical protein